MRWQSPRLYWGGQWLLKNNYSRWALQWTEELNELGSPLYLANDNEALLRLESFVEQLSGDRARCLLTPREGAAAVLGRQR